MIYIFFLFTTDLGGAPGNYGSGVFGNNTYPPVAGQTVVSKNYTITEHLNFVAINSCLMYVFSSKEKNSIICRNRFSKLAAFLDLSINVSPFSWPLFLYSIFETRLNDKVTLYNISSEINSLSYCLWNMACNTCSRSHWRVVASLKIFQTLIINKTISSKSYLVFHIFSSLLSLLDGHFNLVAMTVSCSTCALNPWLPIKRLNEED